MNYITIPGFEDLTEQEVFDASLTFIRSTGKPGMNSSGECSYHMGCAASIFIREEERQDAYGSWSLLMRSRKVPKSHGTLIRGIQDAHDTAAFQIEILRIPGDVKQINAAFMEKFELNMEDVAYRHGLEYKEPNK